jgi:hypothetical protein
MKQPPPFAIVRNTVGLRGLIVALGLVVANLLGGTAGYAQSANFWRALETNDINTLRTELMRGANPNARHPEHGPAIVAAARFKSFDAVRVLASLNATDVDAASANDETALMLVSLLGDQTTFNALLQRGAQVNRPGWTPLHYAASGGQLELVKQLIDQHAFIDAQSVNGTTPLMMASRMRALPVVQYLIDQGADPSLKNQSGLDAAGYLEGNGERQWALWLRRRVEQYVARYGTVEQPRWSSTDAAGTGSDKAPGANADLGAVQMNREVNVAPESASRPPILVPGMAPSSGPQAGQGPKAPSGSKPSPSDTATPKVPGTGSPSASGLPATARPVAPAQPSAAAPGAAPKPAAAVSASTPKPAAAATASAPKPAAPPAPGTVSAPSPSPALTSKPVGTPAPPPAVSSAVRPVAPVSPVSPAPVPPKPATADSEPLFFSRTLSLPADPPAAGTAGGGR